VSKSFFSVEIDIKFLFFFVFANSSYICHAFYQDKILRFTKRLKSSKQYVFFPQIRIFLENLHLFGL